MARSETKKWLDEILIEFNRASFLYSDPLSIVHSYSQPKDQELVGLIAALFSYGNVAAIKKTLAQVLKPLGEHPRKNLLSMRPKDFKKIWRSSYYRFYTEDDIIFLFERLHSLLGSYETLEAAFLDKWNGDILDGISNLRSLFIGNKPKTNGQKFMFSDPHAGTAKRWHMYLRWMVRKDDVDLGLWQNVPKSQLIQPLDTHLFQIGRALKLTTFKSPNLKAALQMTEKFRYWDPADPIKYDFALCRLGVLKQKSRLGGGQGT